MFDVTRAILTPLMMVGRIPDLLRSGRSKSLITYTKSTRSEPVTVVDMRLLNHESLTDILHGATSLYCGYYLQAIAISTNIGNVNVVRLLEKVSPSRDPIEAAGLFLEGGISAESYQYKLPGPDLFIPILSMEARRDYTDEPPPAETTAQGRDSMNIAAASANLSVGKLFDVEINSDGQRGSIPVSVRLIVSPMDTQILRNVLTYAGKDNSMKERYYGLKSGRLKFIADGVFAKDLIREHREMMMKDTSGQYSEMVSRANKNRLAGLLSLSPSVNTAANIYVIDSTTAKEVEGILGGKLDDPKIRGRIMDKGYMMLLYVVNSDYNTVKVYFEGISLPTELSLRDIKQINKNGGMDVAEVLRTLQLGQAPRF